jgi:hypothetical protein
MTKSSLTVSRASNMTFQLRQKFTSNACLLCPWFCMLALPLVQRSLTQRCKASYSMQHWLLVSLPAHSAAVVVAHWALLGSGTLAESVAPSSAVLLTPSHTLTLASSLPTPILPHPILPTIPPSCTPFLPSLPTSSAPSPLPTLPSSLPPSSFAPWFLPSSIPHYHPSSLPSLLTSFLPRQLASSLHPCLSPSLLLPCSSSLVLPGLLTSSLLSFDPKSWMLQVVGVWKK